MGSSMIIGQYVPGNSFVHQIDPRSKMLIIFFYVIFVFFANNVWGYSLLTLFIIITIIITRIPITFIIKALTPTWSLIIFTFSLHLFLIKKGSVAFEILSYKFNWVVTKRGLVISLRRCLLVLLRSRPTRTTTPNERTYATESLWGALKKMRFPLHELACLKSIWLRFIPPLMQETDKIC